MPDIPANTHIFGRTLDDATNSYKFFWLQALLWTVEYQPATVVSLRDLVVEMVVAAWHPVTLYKLSLGPRDMLQRAVTQIHAVSGLPSAAPAVKVRKAVLETPSLGNLASELTRFVPFRFITPWFKNELRGLRDDQHNRRIRELAAAAFGRHSSCPYAFDNTLHAVRIDPGWHGWMRENIAILRAFADSGLARFLQARNPGVPGIPAKLHAPIWRSGLVRGRKFWDVALSALAAQGSSYAVDIYTDAKLNPGFSIDHFLPWSFVAHDLLWNLAPVNRSTNSSKSDAIPKLDRYVPRLAALHRAALGVLSNQPLLLADHIEFLLEDISSLLERDTAWFTDRYTKALRPLAELAALQGFSTGWVARACWPDGSGSSP
jgi:HNH endonuclease